jgi:hypothetical protein
LQRKPLVRGFARRGCRIHRADGLWCHRYPYHPSRPCRRRRGCCSGGVHLLVVGSPGRRSRRRVPLVAFVVVGAVDRLMETTPLLAVVGTWLMVLGLIVPRVTGIIAALKTHRGGLESTGPAVAIHQGRRRVVLVHATGAGLTEVGRARIWSHRFRSGRAGGSGGRTRAGTATGGGMMVLGMGLPRLVSASRLACGTPHAAGVRDSVWHA